jgi:hypothetical protein
MENGSKLGHVRELIDEVQFVGTCFGYDVDQAVQVYHFRSSWQYSGI